MATRFCLLVLFGVVTAEFKHNIYNIKMIGRNACTIDVSEIKFDIIADADFCLDGAKFRQYLMQIRRFFYIFRRDPVDALCLNP